LEEAKAGLVHDIRDVLEHHQTRHDSRWWRIVVPALRHIPAARLVTVAACTPRYVRMLLRGTRQPSATIGVRLWHEAWRWAKRAVARRAAPEAVRRAGTRLLGLGPPPRWPDEDEARGVDHVPGTTGSPGHLLTLQRP
jgi:hypothetical protein